jgi:hypothetical protein
MLSGDTNMCRLPPHPIWSAAQRHADGNLMNLSAGLTRDQVVECKRLAKEELYAGLCFGNGIGLAISKGYADNEIIDGLPKLLSRMSKNMIVENRTKLIDKINKTRQKLHFLEN